MKMAPIHTINRYGTALTVWKCSCGAVSVGEPDDPAFTPRWHRRKGPTFQHDVRPATRTTARGYLDWLGRTPLGATPEPLVEQDRRVVVRAEGS